MVGWGSAPLEGRLGNLGLLENTHLWHAWNPAPDRWVLTSQETQGAQTIATPADIAKIPGLYLYIEGGAQTAASVLAKDLVDRLEIYRAPIVIGGGMPAVRDIGLPELAQAHHRWQRVERRMLGPDTFEAFVRTRGES